MKIFGITGPSGSGKTLLTEYLASRGVPTIDADALYHSMLIPPSAVLDALRRVFGEEIFMPDGTLDRRALGAIVFSSPEKLCLLNSTVLPLVIDAVRKKLADFESGGSSCVAVDAPTLIESGFDKECHTVICVLAPPEHRLERIALRDGIDINTARLRISAQKNDEFYISHSDIVLYNNGTPDEFLSELESKLQEDI